MIGLIVCISLGILIIVGFIWGYFYEKKSYNNGICPKCGYQLEYFDTASDGSNGYICNKCGYTTWVSYSNIDKMDKN